MTDLAIDLPDYACDAQEDFYFDESHRHPAFVSGFGGGKTYAGLAKALDLCAVNRGLPMVLMEPTYPMIARIMWPTLFDEMLDAWGIPYTFNKTDKVVRLCWGSEMWFMTAENPHRLVGTKVAAAYVDEAGLMPELAWKNLDSRVRHPGAKIQQLFATFTPEVPGWTHEKWGRGELYNEPLADGYKLYQASTDENKFLPEYADQLAGEWDSEEAQARIFGKFAISKSGRVYYTFDVQANVTEHDHYDPELPLGISFDFNEIPGMHVEICQEIEGRLHVISEVFGRGLNLEDACVQVCKRYGLRHQGPVWVYGDATGARSASRRGYYQIILDILRNGIPGSVAGFGSRVRSLVRRANPSVADSCSAVRAALCNSRGERSLFVHRSCKRLIHDLQTVRTRAAVARDRGRAAPDKPDDIDKSDLNLTHASDCLRYWVWMVRPLRTRFQRQADFKRMA